MSHIVLSNRPLKFDAFAPDQASFPTEPLPCESTPINSPRMVSSLALDGIVDAVIEIHKSVGWPDFLPQVFACDYLARVFQQNPQDLEWLFLQADSCSVLAQFSRVLLQLEASETNDSM